MKIELTTVANYDFPVGHVTTTRKVKEATLDSCSGQEASRASRDSMEVVAHVVVVVGDVVVGLAVGVLCPGLAAVRADNHDEFLEETSNRCIFKRWKKVKVSIRAVRND